MTTAMQADMFEAARMAQLMNNGHPAQANTAQFSLQTGGFAGLTGSFPNNPAGMGLNATSVPALPNTSLSNLNSTNFSLPEFVLNPNQLSQFLPQYNNKSHSSVPNMVANQIMHPAALASVRAPLTQSGVAMKLTGIDEPSEYARPSKSQDSKSSSAYASRHQAAEQRRRTRINERLELLRKLVPHAERANTACFLEEVIKYIDSLKRRNLQLEAAVAAVQSGKPLPADLELTALPTQALSEQLPVIFLPGAGSIDTPRAVSPVGALVAGGTAAVTAVIAATSRPCSPLDSAAKPEETVAAPASAEPSDPMQEDEGNVAAHVADDEDAASAGLPKTSDAATAVTPELQRTASTQSDKGHPTPVERPPSAGSPPSQQLLPKGYSTVDDDDAGQDGCNHEPRQTNAIGAGNTKPGCDPLPQADTTTCHQNIAAGTETATSTQNTKAGSRQSSPKLFAAPSPSNIAEPAADTTLQPQPLRNHATNSGLATETVSLQLARLTSDSQAQLQQQVQANSLSAMQQELLMLKAELQQVQQDSRARLQQARQEAGLASQLLSIPAASLANLQPAQSIPLATDPHLPSVLFFPSNSPSESMQLSAALQQMSPPPANPSMPLPLQHFPGQRLPVLVLPGAPTAISATPNPRPFATVGMQPPPRFDTASPTPQQQLQLTVQQQLQHLQQQQQQQLLSQLGRSQEATSVQLAMVANPSSGQPQGVNSTLSASLAQIHEQLLAATAIDPRQVDRIGVAGQAVRNGMLATDNRNGLNSLAALNGPALPNSSGAANRMNGHAGTVNDGSFQAAINAGGLELMLKDNTLAAAGMHTLVVNANGHSAGQAANGRLKSASSAGSPVASDESGMPPKKRKVLVL